LRVGASPQVMQSVVAGFLIRYRRTHPGVEVRLTEDGAVRVLDLVERGDVQIAFGTLPVPDTLHARVLFPARILAVIPALSPLARKRTVGLTELAKEPLLLLRAGFATRQIVDGAFQAARIEPHVALESGSPHCLLTFAETGHGIAIVPSTVVLPDGDFRIAPIVQGEISLGFWLVACWDSRRFLPSYGDRFVKELVDYTRQTYLGKRFERGAPPIRPPDSPKNR
jgi:DNA-binding transcriptional LysR family regulator